MPITDLKLWIREAGGTDGPFEFGPSQPVTIGTHGCDLDLPGGTTLDQRHMCTLVPADGQWWLVVPVREPDGRPKHAVDLHIPAQVRGARVLEGGFLALSPGTRGEIRPGTVSEAVVLWEVGAVAPVAVREALRLHNLDRPPTRAKADDDPRQPRRSVLDVADARDISNVAAYEAERALLEAELSGARGPIRTGNPFKLDDRAIDYLVTASWCHWNDPDAPMLPVDDVAGIWQVQPNSVQKELKRSLDALSTYLPDPLNWSKDPRRAFDQLIRIRALQDLHFEWQDLGIAFPGDAPRMTPRADGTVGPRAASDRPIGWRTEP
jgi:hypothetical protein